MIDWDGLVVGAVTQVFGEAVTYFPQGAAAFAATGVYDEEYLDQDAVGREPLAQIGGMVNLSGSRPVLGVQLSAFPVQPSQGDLVKVLRTGDTFVVREVRPDGHGHAKLLLNLAP